MGSLMMSVASLVYLGLMTGMYPWKRLAAVDIIRPLPFDYAEYMKAMGPMLPLGLVGLVVVLISREAAIFPAVARVSRGLHCLGDLRLSRSRARSDFRK